MNTLVVVKETENYLVVSNLNTINPESSKTVFLKLLEKSTIPVSIQDIDTNVKQLDFPYSTPIQPKVNQSLLLSNEKIIATYMKGILKTIDPKGIVHFRKILKD